MLLVFVDHAKRPAFTGGFLYTWGTFGQEAVAAFFVLSGLVISRVAFSRERSLPIYGVARLARLWSVVIPAILLTVVLDSLGSRIDPSLYSNALLPPWTLDWGSLGRMIAPALFLNSVHPFHVAVGSDGPFWSLSYEAWYYAAFGFAVFLTGWRRILLVVAVAWFAGSDILVLAPIWVFGVAIGALLGKGKESRLAWIGYGVSILALLFLAVARYKIMAELQPLLPYENLPQRIVQYYATGALIGLHIVCFDRIHARLSSVTRVLEKPVRLAVGRSFSIYLYQAPLLFFIASLLHGVTSPAVRIFVLYVGTLTLCVILAEFTERRKFVVARWLRSGLALVAPSRAAPVSGR